MAKKKETAKDDDGRKADVVYGTGATLLDCTVGGGEYNGYPSGRIINLWGNSSSGKTFLACEIIASAYYKFKDKFQCKYDDAESGFSFDTEKLWGFEIMPKDETKRFKSGTVEQLQVNVLKFINSLAKDEYGIYVIDSLDGLTDNARDERTEKRLEAAEKGEEFDEGTYAMSTQKFLSQEFFPVISEAIEKSNCLLIIISQARDNVGAGLYGKKDKRSGGRALDFYCQTVLKITKMDTIEKKGRAIGSVVKCKAEKSKTPRPYRECMLNLLYDYGLDSIGSNIDFLFNLRSEKTGELLTKANTIEWEKDSEVLFTRDELIKFIYDNDLIEELNKRTVEKWETIEASIKIDRPRKY